MYKKLIICLTEFNVVLYISNIKLVNRPISGVTSHHVTLRTGGQPNENHALRSKRAIRQTILKFLRHGLLLCRLWVLKSF